MTQHLTAALIALGVGLMAIAAFFMYDLLAAVVVLLAGGIFIYSMYRPARDTK